MLEESVTQSPALVRTLDDPRNVRHHERSVTGKRHDTEPRLECGKGVVGDLRLGRRDDGEQCALPRVRFSQQPHVGDYLEDEFDGTLLALLARLPLARSLVC